MAMKSNQRNAAQKLLDGLAVYELHQAQGTIAVNERIEAFITAQRAIYARAKRKDLIDALLDRDRLLATTGQQAVEQRMAGRIFVDFLGSMQRMLSDRRLTVRDDDDDE